MTITDWGNKSAKEAAETLAARLENIGSAQREAAVSAIVDNLEEAFASKREGPLSGAPCFVKDLFDVCGFPTHAGSKLLAKIRPPPHEDSAIARALRNAGAVLVGKTHMHEFAYGLTGENTHYGNCLHPQYYDRTSGGSSSGSAVVVASGIVPMSIGTDTGGSIRIPAAYCGLFGLRLVPHHHFIRDSIGVSPRGFPLAPSFDTPGWFASNASDLRRINFALLNHREAQIAPKGLFLHSAISNEYVHLAESLSSSADGLTAETLRNIFEGSGKALTVLQSCEAFEIHKRWLDIRRDDYSALVWQRIDRGRRWCIAELRAAELKLCAVRDGWTEYFKSHDFLILPSAPSAALKVDEFTQANRDSILELTAPATLAGLPVLSVPIRLSDRLTNGIQIIVKHSSSAVIDWVLRELESRSRS